MLLRRCESKTSINNLKFNSHERIRNLERKAKFRRHLLQIVSFHIVSKGTAKKWNKMTNAGAGRRRARACRYHCFKSLNLHICEIIVAVTVVLRELKHQSRHRQRHRHKSKFVWLNGGKIIVRASYMCVTHFRSSPYRLLQNNNMNILKFRF